MRIQDGQIKCKGQCSKLLPATEEHFFFRKSSKNGKRYSSTYCKICEKAKSAQSRKDRYSTAEGKEVISCQNKDWRDSHPEYTEGKLEKQNMKYAKDLSFQQSRKDYARRWRTLNPDKKRAANAAWHQRTKHRTNRKRALFATFYPDLKLRNIIRIAVCEAMKFGGGSKGGRSVLKYLPYSMKELQSHLESLWEPWMRWSNYGPWSAHRQTWQIDHIAPQVSLPFSDFSHPNFLKCWALSNLRPLESSKNISKGCR